MDDAEAAEDRIRETNANNRTKMVTKNCTKLIHTN